MMIRHIGVQTTAFRELCLLQSRRQQDILKSIIVDMLSRYKGSWLAEFLNLAKMFFLGSKSQVLSAAGRSWRDNNSLGVS